MNQNPIPVIRKAMVADAHELSQLIIDCWNEAYENILSYETLKNLDKIVTVDKYIKLLSSNHNIYVLWFKSKIIGFLSFRQILNSYPDLQKPSEIYSIYVKKLFWGMGFGKKLLDFAEQEIINQYQAKSILVWTLENNIKSHIFYTRNNYKHTQYRKEFILFEASYPQIMFLKEIE